MSFSIDYNKLCLISTDPTNKTKDAHNESTVLSSYIVLLQKLLKFGLQLKVNEMALFINSTTHWISNKDKTSTRSIKVGDIIEIECGLNYSPELSYRHWAIVLEVLDKNILCVPTTSSYRYRKELDERPTSWYYILVGKSEGFKHDCVALLRDLKIISKSRLIATHGNILESETGSEIFRCIRLLILENYFSKEIMEYKAEIDDLKSTITNQKTKINSLYKIIENYKKKNKK